jgi:arylsulfatase A-like enzyme
MLSDPVPLGERPAPQAASPPGAAKEEKPPPRVRQKPLQFLLLGMWFGLLTGLLETAVFGMRRFLFGLNLGYSRDVFWMAPLAELLFFGILGVVFSLIAWCRPRLVPVRLGVFVFLFLGFFSVLFMFSPQLHKYAGMLLAAGLATVISHFLAPWVGKFDPYRRHTLRAMLALAGGVGLGTYAWRRHSESRALAKLSPTRADAPNVLLIVLDTVRAASLSLHGYQRPTTPHLERFAKAGVRFEWAMSTAPWTLASHATMFTGRYPHELSADWLTPLDASYPTLAEFFGERGYLTAGFIANTRYCSYEHGLDRGFVHYEDYPVSPEQIVASSSLVRYLSTIPALRQTTSDREFPPRKSAAEINRAFLNWVSRKEQRPFFAFLNYFDAHAPYLPPPPFDLQFGRKRASAWNRLARAEFIPAHELRAMVDGYDGALAYLDTQLDLLFDELRRQGILDNTLVIITSDHGEEFGEHGLLDHGNSLYLASVHVPLVFHFPGRVPAGQVIRAPVSLRDLAATVMDVLKLQDESPFPGESLARCWQVPQDPERPNEGPLLSEVNRLPNVPLWLPVSRGNMKSLLVDGWRYIRNGDGQEEVYDMAKDSWEQRDLSSTDEGSRLLPRFRDCLERLLAGRHA